VDGSNEYPGTVLTIDEALEEMITYSDNGAALALVRVYGAAATNAALEAAGVHGFHVAENGDEDNIVTARALGTFFDLLATRRLISAGASDRMLVRLERQQINDRLPRDLPAGALVAHKTGDLIGFSHDAGVIQTPEGPRIAVVLSSGGTETAAKDLIARVGTLVYSAVLPALPGPRAESLPGEAGAAAFRGFGLVQALAVAVIGLIGLAGLLRVGRSTPRRWAARRGGQGSGPMAVWSPPRSRRAGRPDPRTRGQ
jgi:beta-lactamase class A